MDRATGTDTGTDEGTARTAHTASIPLVQARRVTKRLGNRQILRAIDLELRPAQRTVLFGPNGAGKTTLLRILSTLSRPTTGEVYIDGHSAQRQALEVRRRVGVLAHQPYLYDDLTASENLRFFARMYDVKDASSRIDEVLALVGLINRRDDRVRTFSRGMQQRLAIARAMLHKPALLLFDEPDTGLDSEGTHVLARILAMQVGTGGGVLMTTHDLRFGLAAADRVLMLDAGRLTMDEAAGSVSEADLEQRLVQR